MNEFRGGKDVSNKYMNVSSFLNKSMNFEGCEIQEEYDQEEENLIVKENLQRDFIHNYLYFSI